MYVYDEENPIKNIKLNSTFNQEMSHDGFYISFTHG